MDGLLIRASDLRLDDLRLSNSLTAEHNVLGPGVISHIVRNRTVNTSTMAATDSYFHYDQVGSVMSTTNAAGALASRRYADAFGNTIQPWSWQNGLWHPTSGWGHNTKKHHMAAGLTHMYQRWYLPETGTFMSDSPYPPHFEGSFVFADSNPTSWVDPKGLLKVCCRPVRLPGGDRFNHCYFEFSDGSTLGLHNENGTRRIVRNSPEDMNQPDKKCGPDFGECKKGCVLGSAGKQGADPAPYEPKKNNCNTFEANALKDCGNSPESVWPNGLVSNSPGIPGLTD